MNDIKFYEEQFICNDANGNGVVLNTGGQKRGITKKAIKGGSTLSNIWL